MSTLNIYDGNAFLAIGSYGFGKRDSSGNRKPLSWSGFPTGGLYCLLRTLTHHMYDYNIIVFDSKSMRKQLDSSYKSNRTGDKTDIIAQQAVAVHYLRKAGFQVFKKDGYEGDDLIHHAVKTNLNKFYDIRIFGNDMDLACNIDEMGKVVLQSPTKNSKTVTRSLYQEVVNNDYYVPYNSILPFKVFYGDKSDHILKPKHFDGDKLWNLFYAQVSKRIPVQQMWSDREVMDWFISVLSKALTPEAVKELKHRADLVYPLPLQDLDMTAQMPNLDRDVLKSLFKMFGMKSLLKILTDEKEPSMELTQSEIFEFKTIRNNYKNGIYSIDEGTPLTDHNAPNLKLELVGHTNKDSDEFDDILNEDNIASKIYLGSNMGDIE